MNYKPGSFKAVLQRLFTTNNSVHNIPAYWLLVPVTNSKIPAGIYTRR